MDHDFFVVMVQMKHTLDWDRAYDRPGMPGSTTLKGICQEISLFVVAGIRSIEAERGYLDSRDPEVKGVCPLGTCGIHLQGDP